MKIHILIITLISFISQLSLAQSSTLFNRSSLSDETFRTRHSEYFYNKEKNAVLLPVRLLGNVKSPGLYHVPQNTPLLTLISIAGGTGPKAEVDSIQLAKSDGKTEIRDIEGLMKGHDYLVKGGETVFIPTEDPLFDDSTVNALAVTSSVLSVLITGFLLIESTK